MSTTITLTAATLQRVLANGSLFAASAKDYLPALEVVRFDWDGDTLLAVATNRYVLSYETVEYEGNGNTEGRDPFSVHAGDAKRIISILKSLRSPGFPVAVKYDSESGKATFMIDGDTIIVTTDHGNFAQWRRLVDGRKNGERGTVAFNPKWLALFAKVDAGQRVPIMRLEFADTSNGGPVHIAMGEHFRGLITAVTDNS